MHDFVIENASLIDGFGSPANRAASRCTMAGSRRSATMWAGARADRRRGQGAGSGIVDLHTHFDAQLLWIRSRRRPSRWASPAWSSATAALPSPRAGRRTATRRCAIDACRGDAARSAARQQVIGASRATRTISGCWRRKGMVPTFGSLRRALLGAHLRVAGRRFAPCRYDAAKWAEMKRLVVEAMHAGAVGFATSTLEQHDRRERHPHAVAAGRRARADGADRRTGRSRQGRLHADQGHDHDGAMAGERRGAQRPAGHDGCDVHRPQRSAARVQRVEEIGAARKRGRELWGQGPVGFRSAWSCPPCAIRASARSAAVVAARDGGRGSEQFENLADPEFRRAVKAEASSKTVPNRFSYHSLEHIKILEVQQPRHRGLVGRVVAEVARSEGKDPFDWYLDFGLDGELDALVDCKLFNTGSAAVRHLLRHPHAAIALSDAGAHLAFLCDAGFGLHLFGHSVRERGDMTPRTGRAMSPAMRPASTASRIAAGSRRAPGPT